jgi:superfamily II DNA or RNA helicase
MRLAARCERSFRPATRSDGYLCYRRDTINLLPHSGDSARFVIKEKQGATRQVEIDWSLAPEGSLIGICTCSIYLGGSLCEHVWAALLMLDELGLIDIKGTRPLKMLHESQAPLVEGFLEEFDDDEFDDDEWMPFNLSQTLSRASAMRQQAARPDWQQVLDEVSAREAQDDRQRKVVPAARQREPWFVLRGAATQHEPELLLELWQRELKKNGQFGKFKKLDVQRNGPWNFLRPEDEELVHLLLGCRSTDELSWGYYAYRSQRFRSFVLDPSTAALWLPRLCATARLVWQAGTSAPNEGLQPVSWDSGDPWQFQLGATADGAAQQWQLEGQLVRGEETRPLSAITLVTRSGFVLFSDSLARIQVGADFAWLARLLDGPAVTVPYAAREPFLKSLYSQRYPPETAFPPELTVAKVVGKPTGKLRIQAAGKSAYYAPRDALLASGCFVYGDKSIPFSSDSGSLYDEQAGQVTLRDSQRESELLAQLAALRLRKPDAYFFHGVDYLVPKKRLSEVVLRLTAEGWTVEAEGMRVRRAGAVHLSVHSNVDWFELEGRVDFEGATASLPSLLAAIRSQERVVLLDDGSQGLIPDKWLERYGSLLALGQAHGAAVRFRPSQALLLDALLVEHEQQAECDQGFAEFRQRLAGFAGIRPGEAPPGFQGTLRQYQKEGLGWLEFLRGFRFGGCLADDMGLGKTIQVLAMLEERRVRSLNHDEERRPSLVVVPKSLVFNWLDEAARFTPALRTLNYTGNDRKPRLAEVADADLLITTYGTLRNDIVDLKEIHFDYAILDEAQAIKNHNSQAAKASRLINAAHRLALTGTPVENHLGELWSLFEFLNPGMLGRSSAFSAWSRNRREQDESAVALLGAALRPFLLRRTKEQVLSELPEKTEQTIICELSPKERKKYNELRDYYRAQLSQRVEQIGLQKAKIHVLEALLRLRQAACHLGLLDAKQADEPSAKLESLLEQVEEVIAEGHKALVFSQFTSLLALVRKQLDQRGIVYEYLDGSTRDRGARVQRFQEDSACPLFLISLKAGGQGLNLTAADYVFILDPWWNPAVEAQAVDRAHRIGQTQRVFAYRLICRDTVEDKILELQKSKRQLADAIVSADNSVIQQLTAEDLQLLLS